MSMCEPPYLPAPAPMCEPPYLPARCHDTALNYGQNIPLSSLLSIPRFPLSLLPSLPPFPLSLASLSPSFPSLPPSPLSLSLSLFYPVFNPLPLPQTPSPTKPAFLGRVLRGGAVSWLCVAVLEVSWWQGQVRDRNGLLKDCWQRCTA